MKDLMAIAALGVLAFFAVTFLGKSSTSNVQSSSYNDFAKFDRETSKGLKQSNTGVNQPLLSKILGIIPNIITLGGTGL